MRISTKFWLCITALVMGYMATVGLNSILSRRNEALLERTAEVAFPAAQEAQAAQADFKRQLQTYQDAIVLGEADGLAKAEGIAGEVRLRLEALIGDDRLAEHRRKQALALVDELKSYSARADISYRQIAAGETSQALMAAAGVLEREGRDLLGRIEDFARDLSVDLRGIIDTTIEATVRQRAASEIAFVVIAISTLSVIAVIIARWARRLDDVMYAADRLAKGDYHCDIGGQGNDEVGLLAQGFDGMRQAVQRRDQELRAFNETLEAQVRERTQEIEERNNDLAKQIGERRRAEQSLRLLDEAVAQIPEAVVVVTADADPEAQRFAYVNPGFARLLGIHREESSSLSMAILWNENDRDPRNPLRALTASVLGGRPGNVELQTVLANGQRMLDVHAAPVRDDSDTVTHIVYFIRDITDRRVLEAQRSQGQKLESIGQLAAGVAHEINTPIQFVGDNLRFLDDSFSEILVLLNAQERLRSALESAPISGDAISTYDACAAKTDLGYLREEVPKAINQSLEGVNRVATIVRALKEFAHPESPNMQANDLHRAIESTLAVSRNEYKYVADLVTEFDPDVPSIECLIGEINQVVLNMVINASHAISDVVKDSGTKGTITITTRRDGDWVEVRITDTGCGMSSAVQERIFEPFFTTKPVGKGTGQGLYIAHDIIVKKHHGRILVTSAPGSGTTFAIRLPITQPR